MQRLLPVTVGLSAVIILMALGHLVGSGGQAAYANGDGHTHFRYGHYSWIPLGGNTIEFTLQNAWRRDAYSTVNGRCRNPATLLSIPCTGGDGFAGVGDVIVESQGFTLFDPGDGSGTIGSPAGPLLYLVTSIDPANNWLFGLALDPASLPAVDTTISHTYANPGNYTAFTDSCCRISGLFAGNNHINNPDGGYRVETTVNVDTGNRSPVSALPPIVSCPINALCAFLVPAADPDGDTLSFRLSAPAEASSFIPFGACPTAFCQPGTPGSGAPILASISPAGLYTWDTTGATLGPASTNTLYSTQVTIEDLDTSGNVKGKVALDFLIQLVPVDPNPPVIGPPAGSPPVCATTQVAAVGITKTFGVAASDPDSGDLVTLNVVALPVGATMTPPLPVVGNPVGSTFSWTPTAGQVGLHLVTFSASSTGGGFVLCSVTIEVSDRIVVVIDIKPGSFPNSINTKSKGTVPVAILSTPDFDAPGDVEKTSLKFGPTGIEQSLAFCNKSAEDVNGDGLLDQVCHFHTQLTGFQEGDTDGILSGTTVDGAAFEGRDSVRIVK